MNTTAFTPHARGSTRLPLESITTIVVYPACAGIDLLLLKNRLFVQCLPRMRGDRPLLHFFVEEAKWFTPHARGSTQKKLHKKVALQVYPACAGIDPDGRESQTDF